MTLLVLLLPASGYLGTAECCKKWKAQNDKSTLLNSSTLPQSGPFSIAAQGAERTMWDLARRSRVFFGGPLRGLGKRPLVSGVLETPLRGPLEARKGFQGPREARQGPRRGVFVCSRAWKEGGPLRGP